MSELSHSVDYTHANDGAVVHLQRNPGKQLYMIGQIDSYFLIAIIEAARHLDFDIRTN
jgi:hypothetical protein